MCSNEYVIRPLLRVQYEKNKMTRMVYSEMTSKQIKCHFSSHIRNISNLDHYAKSNIFTKHNKWFKFMYSPEENNQKMIDFTCQKMMSYLYICYEITICAGPKNIKSSFWYNAMSFWNQDSFATLVNTFPPSVRSKPCFIILIYILSDILFQNVDNSISTIKKINSSSTREATMVSGGHSLNFDQENREVCGFVLSQVVKMIRKYDELERSNLTSINDSRISNRIALLNEIRTFEENIVDDEFYVKNCYSEQDQILNRGRLSLISSHYYTFAVELMNVIRSNTT